jgi:hypothetical protein
MTLYVFKMYFLWGWTSSDMLLGWPFLIHFCPQPKGSCYSVFSKNGGERYDCV